MCYFLKCVPSKERQRSERLGNVCRTFSKLISNPSNDSNPSTNFWLIWFLSGCGVFSLLLKAKRLHFMVLSFIGPIGLVFRQREIEFSNVSEEQYIKLVIKDSVEFEWEKRRKSMRDVEQAISHLWWWKNKVLVLRT